MGCRPYRRRIDEGFFLKTDAYHRTVRCPYRNRQRNGAAYHQQALPAVSLSTHTALNTAFVNDVDSSLVFAQQVMGLGNAGDLLWGLSTSGNSENIVSAVVTATALGA